MLDVSPATRADYRADDAAAPARVFPANAEAERQFLGSLLMQNDVLSPVAAFMKPEHFSLEIHQRIYSLAASMIGQGQVASPVTLRTFLGEHDLGGVTVPQYLARLVADVVAPVTASSYARHVRDLAARRKIMTIAAGLMAQASDAPIDMKPIDIANEALGALHGLFDEEIDTDSRREPGKVAHALLERARAIQAGEQLDEGISTGLADLDRETGGFQPGTLWVLGGRPRMGKTILGTGFSKKVAMRGARDLADGRGGVGAQIFSLEVTEGQIIARLLADIGYTSRRPVTFGQIMRGAIAPDEIEQLEKAQRELAALPLALDVAPSLSVAEIAGRVRAEKARMARGGVRLGVVVIDYMKFIKASDRYRGNRVYEVGEITKGLKELAKSESLCVVLLAQVNRAVDGRDRRDRRPTLADLRESGDLEADADVVAFIHRESVHIKQSAEYRSGDPETVQAFIDAERHAELIIAKSRVGAEGVVHLWFHAGASTFASQAREGFA